jgi:hypothetical protein
LSGWPQVIIVSIVLSELFLHLPLLDNIRKISRVGSRSAGIMASSLISEHWKEKALKKYSCLLAVNSTSLLLCLIFLSIGFLALIAMSDWLIPTDAPVLDAFLNWQGLGLAIISSLLYVRIRR